MFAAIAGLYVVCSIYAFLLSLLINEPKNFYPKLWLSIMPTSVLIYAVLLYYFQLHRPIRLFLYSIILLSLQSVLTTLYFNLCEVEYDHTPLSALLTLVLLLLCFLVLFKTYRKEEFKRSESFAAVMVMITFEVCARIEGFSIIIQLNKWFSQTSSVVVS